MEYKVSIDTVADRLAIEQCLYRNALGCDTLDLEMWKSSYWPEAFENHLWYKGNAHAYVDANAIQLRKGMDTSWHKLSNVLVAVDGKHARVNSYYLAYCRIRAADGTPQDLIGGGRYIDHFESRDGEWRIISRTVKSDWTRQDPSTYIWGTEVMHGYVPQMGMRDADDPSRILFDR
jgi:hypothetical protein